MNFTAGTWICGSQHIWDLRDAVFEANAQVDQTPIRWVFHVAGQEAWHGPGQFLIDICFKWFGGFKVYSEPPI